MKRRIVATLAVALAGSAATGPATAQTAEMRWRKAAWSMRSLAPVIPTTRRVKWDEPVFVQPVALAEAAEIASDTTVEVVGMPLAKAPVTLSFAKGSRFYRVETAEAGRRIYCGADSGYTARTAMIRLQSRLCLADDNGDMVFDRLMLASISRPVEGAPPLSPVYLLGLDNPSYQPLVISDDARQSVSIPFALARPDARQFFIGPVLMRQGKAFAAGMMLADAEGRGTATTLFDPATDGIPGAEGMPRTLVKRPQFKHMRPISLDTLPATLELAGARLIVRSFDKDGAEIEVVRDFAESTVPVAFSGVVADDR